MKMFNSTLRDENSNLKGINLQLFAEGQPGEEGNQDPGSDDNQNQGNLEGEGKPEGDDQGAAGEGAEEKKETYTAEEVQEMLQREGDKRVSEAEKKFKERYEAKRKQAEELAKLSAEDRKKRELELEREQFEQERQEFQREKLKLQTIKDMNERKLPIEFSEMVMGQDAETTLKNIKSFEAKWNEALSEAVKDKLKGRDRKTGGSIGDGEEDPFLKGFNSI